MCLGFGDLQPSEIILSGETSCPYQDSFSSFVFDERGRLGDHQLCGRVSERGDSGEHLLDHYSFLHQLANLSRAVNEYDDCPVHLQGRFKNSYVSLNHRCQRNLLHQTRHRGVEFDSIASISQIPRVRSPRLA